MLKGNISSILNVSHYIVNHQRINLTKKIKDWLFHALEQKQVISQNSCVLLWLEVGKTILFYFPLHAEMRILINLAISFTTIRRFFTKNPRLMSYIPGDITYEIDNQFFSFVSSEKNFFVFPFFHGIATLKNSSVFMQFWYH